MRVLLALVGVSLALLAVLVGSWGVQFLVRERAGILPQERATPIAAVRPRTPPFPTAPPRPPSPPPAAHVVCEGCERTPRVSVRPRETIRTIGSVTERLRYTPDAYTLLGGRPAYPHELVREILEQQKLGHLTFRVEVPHVTYDIRGEEERPGVYRVRPGDVSLAENVVIAVDFSIRYPTLTDPQFAFLRDTKDYRFVYGLIRGIVRHEERHLRVLTAYLNGLRDILASPVTSDVPVPVATREEFQEHARAELGRILGNRIAAARAAHERAQAAIDDPARTARIEFVFEEEVNGSVPPPLVAEFTGEGQFSFVLPAGPPRPPAPTIPK